MPKYCDEDKLKHSIHEFVNEYGKIIGMSITDFNIMLERNRVDVVEVVKCKDCKYYGTEVGGVPTKGYCKKTEFMTKYENDFCSWGEKR